MTVRTALRLAVAGAVSITILAACGSSGATPTPASSGSTGPASHTISGTVSYAGTISPTHQIIIVANRTGEQAPAYSVVIRNPGPYTLTDVANGTYAISALMDLGDDMGPPGANEPAGAYDSNGDGTADPVTIQGGVGQSGVDIVLKDK